MKKSLIPALLISCLMSVFAQGATPENDALLEAVLGGLDTPHGRDNALRYCAEKGYFAHVKNLVEQHRADVHYRQLMTGSTPLMLAAGNGHLPVVKYFLEVCELNIEAEDSTYNRISIDPQEVPWNHSPLMCAAEGDHVSVVRYLCDHGANVDARDGYGNSVLMRAAEFGSTDVVSYLLERYVIDVNELDGNGNTVLMKAAVGGHLRLVQNLVGRGANIEATDRKGNTALILAATSNNPDLVQYLCDRGANVQAANNDNNTALSCVVAGYKFGDSGYYIEGRGEDQQRLAIVKYLVEQCEADVEVRDGEGKGLLMMAAAGHNLELVKYLVEQREADVKATDSSGNTVLGVAVQSGNSLQIVFYLIKQDGITDIEDVLKANIGNARLLFNNAISYGECYVAQILAEHCPALLRGKPFGDFYHDCQLGMIYAGDAFLHEHAGNNKLRILPVYMALKNGHKEVLASMLGLDGISDEGVLDLQVGEDGNQTLCVDDEVYNDIVRRLPDQEAVSMDVGGNISYTLKSNSGDSREFTQEQFEMAKGKECARLIEAYAAQETFGLPRYKSAEEGTYLSLQKLMSNYVKMQTGEKSSKEVFETIKSRCKNGAMHHLPHELKLYMLGWCATSEAQGATSETEMTAASAALVSLLSMNKGKSLPTLMNESDGMLTRRGIEDALWSMPPQAAATVAPLLLCQ